MSGVGYEIFPRYFFSIEMPQPKVVFVTDLTSHNCLHHAGRAIRHINDYASVLLLDQRYAGKRDKLPQWIGRSLVIGEAFGPCQGRLARFFREKGQLQKKS